MSLSAHTAACVLLHAHGLADAVSVSSGQPWCAGWPAVCPWSEPGQRCTHLRRCQDALKRAGALLVAGALGAVQQAAQEQGRLGIRVALADLGPVLLQQRLDLRRQGSG